MIRRLWSHGRSAMAAVAAAAIVISSTGTATQAAPGTNIRPTAAPAVSTSGLRFEPNMGQTDARALFMARAAGYGVFLTHSGAVIALADGPAFSLGFAGAAPTATATPESRLAGASSYLTGADRSRWRTDVPGFGAVRYQGIYPGVDAVFYGNDQRLEYDFVVAPGGDPSRVRLALEGVDRVRIDASGDLVLGIGDRELTQLAPVAYQVGSQGREVVPCAYRLDGREVSLVVGEYDRALPLVVDPVLNYSTYLGGNGIDAAAAIAVDELGNAYIAGETTSTDFPTQLGLPISSSGRDAFITKLDRTGSDLVFSTYLGGSGSDAAAGLVLGADGSVFVTGTTSSPDFPLAGGAFVRRGAGVDIFFSKLAPDGRSLTFSGAYGGNGADDARAIAVDAAGAIFLTGSTESTDFPTQLPIQISSGGGDEDVFVTKLNAAGSSLVYSTYLGGSDRDIALGMIVTATGAPVIAGGTRSTNFPTRRALQNANAGARDAFVVSIVPTGIELDYSTYLGGTFNDYATSVALDSSGNIYLTGQTFSGDFPTEGETQTNLGNGDAFVTELSPGAAGIVFSTFVGGTDEDQGNSVAVDSTNSAYITGFTSSANFPTRLPLQTDPGDGAADAFVVKVNSAGTRIAYSTYFGGSGVDRGTAIAVDGSGNAYVAGRTTSANLPLQDPVDATLAEEDGFVVKVGNAFADLGVTITGAPEPVRSGSQLTYTVTVTNNGADAAGNVLLTTRTPAGTTFVSAESSQGDCELPAVGAQGDVVCLIGPLAATATATLTFVVRVTAPAGETVTAEATVTSTATDINAVNDTATVTSTVITPVDPPIVTSVESLNIAPKPYRVRINGSNFQPGVQVFVGTDTTPWPSIKQKGTTRIVLKGATLKARFPKNVPVPIRVVNPDGGEATTTFAR